MNVALENQNDTQGMNSGRGSKATETVVDVDGRWIQESWGYGER